MKIGWIGTGLMGVPMVRRLLGGGFDVAVTTRTPEKAQPVLDDGASWSDSIAALTAAVDVVVSTVPFPADVERIYRGPGGVFDSARPGLIAVDMSTSSPVLAAELAAAGMRRSVTVLDAPVSGGPFGAAQGTLSIMVGGEADAVDRVRPMLSVMGKTVVYHGPAGSGQRAKLVNQVLVAGVTLGICEAFGLAEACGLDLARVHESLRPGIAGSQLLDWAWPRLVDGDLSPGFKLEHFLKDLGLAVDEAASERLVLPGTALVERLAQAVADRIGGEHGTQALATAITSAASDG